MLSFLLGLLIGNFIGHGFWAFINEIRVERKHAVKDYQKTSQEYLPRKK